MNNVATGGVSNGSDRVRPIVFTDLDGTLLDHHDYSFSPAQSLLREMEEKAIPLVFNSSKTRAEIEPLRLETRNSHPFVVENGAAVFVPEGYFAVKPQGSVVRDNYWVREFGQPRRHWLQVLENVRTAHPDSFETFWEMQAEGIAQLSGLKPEQAALANKREYTEPLVWTGEPSRKQSFINELVRSGAYVQQGGRFLHLTGTGDKGVALQWLRHHYQMQRPNQVLHTIALGDSQNDAPMLERSDTAIVIASPTNGELALRRRDNIYRSQACGPSGWEQSLRPILKKLENSND